MGLLRRRRAELRGPVHVGVLVPWANQVVEAELPPLGTGLVVWHYARLVPANQGTRLDTAFLTGLIDAVPAALHQISRLPLVSAYVACTSAGFAVPSNTWPASGDGGAFPVLTAFDAVCGTLAELGSRRVLLCTPYPHAVATQEAAALQGHGVEVLDLASLGLDDGYATIAPGQIHELIGRVEPDRTIQTIRADAVVLSCTGWPTLALLDELEERLGLPVVSSNLAMAITALASARQRDAA